MSDLSFLENNCNDKIDDNILTRLSELSRELKILRGEENEEIVGFLFDLISNFARNTELSLASAAKAFDLYEEKERKISREFIPVILNNASLSEIKLDTGEKISIEDVYYPSLAKDSVQDAYKEMIEIEKKEKKLDDEQAKDNIDVMFKDIVSMEKLTKEEKEKLISFCIKENIPFSHEKNIHFKTLQAYIKRQMQIGGSIPKKVSLFVYKQTKIK